MQVARAWLILPRPRTEPGMPARIDETRAIRIVVVDDHPMMRAGIVAALSIEPDFSVVGHGGTTEEALELVARLGPDVVLVDINMPGCGLTAVAGLAAAWPRLAIIVVTSREDEAAVGGALRNGARGYVLKGTTGRELARIIRTVFRGEDYVTPALAARLLTRDRFRESLLTTSAGSPRQVPPRDDALIVLPDSRK